MSRCVFFNVSAPGHVIPTLGLVKELVKEGDEIYYYEVPPFQPEIEALGATFMPYPQIKPYQGPVIQDPFHNELDLALILSWCALEWVPQLLEPVRELKPDYIIHDSLSLWGRIVAQVLGIPAVCSISTAALNKRAVSRSAKLWKDLPKMALKFKPALKTFKGMSQQLSDTYGIPKISFIDTFTNPQETNICYLPRALQPKESAFDQRYHFVGPCNPVRQMEFDFPLDQLSHERLVYISFGSLHDPGIPFFKNCIQALKDVDCQVVMLTPPFSQTGGFG